MADTDATSARLPGLSVRLAQVVITTPSPSFLGIPIEVRLIILRILLLLRYVGVLYQLFGMTSPRSAQILAICKQLYLEGHPVLYQEATFDYGFHGANKFPIPLVLYPYLSSIRHAAFNFPRRGDADQLLLVDKITCLESLKTVRLSFLETSSARGLCNTQLLKQFFCFLARYRNIETLRSLREEMPETVITMTVTYLHSRDYHNTKGQHVKSSRVAGSGKFSIEEILDAVEGRFPKGDELSLREKAWLKGEVEGPPENAWVA